MSGTKSKSVKKTNVDRGVPSGTLSCLSDASIAKSLGEFENLNTQREKRLRTLCQNEVDAYEKARASLVERMNEAERDAEVQCLCGGLISGVGGRRTVVVGSVPGLV